MWPESRRFFVSPVVFHWDRRSLGLSQRRKHCRVILHLKYSSKNPFMLKVFNDSKQSKLASRRRLDKKKSRRRFLCPKKSYSQWVQLRSFDPRWVFRELKRFYFGLFTVIFKIFWFSVSVKTFFSNFFATLSKKSVTKPAVFP